MPGRSRYHAPPVSCLVGRCVLAGVLLGLLGLTSAGALLGGTVWGATLVDHPEAVRSLVLGGAAWCLVLGWAVWQWWHSPQGRLVWREGQWQWLQQGATDVADVAAVKLAWDAQAWMLLQLVGEPWRRRWVWAERSRNPACWDDVRRAVWATHTGHGGQR